MYYFSGTGNSLYVCRHLAGLLGESVCPMTSPVPSDDASVGLVFPVYAWGIPNVVERFVREHDFSGRFLYAVMTCGDDMGYTDRVLESALRRRLDAAFSVLMPDVYVCLPGFDVDSEEERSEKLRQEEVRVREIAQCVRERKNVRLLRRGAFAWTKTYIVRPLFNRFLLTDKYFHVDASMCISCQRCSRSCPVSNIRMADGTPRWQSHCTGCLACYHVCPHHAINFGSMTQRKGQYVNNEEMKE